MNQNIQMANEEALKRINEGMPVLVDIKFAHEVLPGMRKNVIGHSGPPVTWDDMCGPMKGAIVGVIKYEGLAENDEEAVRLVETGGVEFVSNHSMGAVGPMTGMISYSMPLYEVKNETFGNYAYSTFNEGLGKVMRFGANNEEVLERLRFMDTSLAPALKKALTHTGPLNVRVLMSEALAMGDEMHQRNIAASLLFGKTVLPAISRVVEDVEERFRITSFITDNKQFFLNLCMAAGKAMMDPVKNIEGSTVVTAMSRNGTNFGIKVSGLGDEWFEAPVNMPKGLYFPGYSEADANPDMGDSTIVETIGLGGFTMGAAPAVVRFVGAASVEAALNYSRDMMEITVGQSPSLLMPTMNFEGAPTGIDIRKVVETGILPVINTGMAHKEPGIGQIGAGIVEAPLECFMKAVLRYSEVYNI
jgi:hypothetical protein